MKDDFNDAGNVQAAIMAGMAIADFTALTTDGRVQGVVLPPGASIKQIDLAEYAPYAPRAKGTMTLATVESFSAWVNKHRTPVTFVMADSKNVTMTAVFNGDQPGGKAGWRDHKAVYPCPLSDEWVRWMKYSQHASDLDRKQGMKHSDFVQFIEDNIVDITNPAAGAMLSTVRSFDAKKEVKFGSAVRLENGDVGFNYTEGTEQTPGTVKLPEKFVITIPVFQGGVAYEIDANLRYRIAQNGLTLWYELVRPHKSLEHAFKQAVQKAHDALNKADVTDPAPIPFYAV